MPSNFFSLLLTAVFYSTTVSLVRYLTDIETMREPSGVLPAPAAGGPRLTHRGDERFPGGPCPSGSFIFRSR
jgi:hypothetical protein